jgi:hypothetical protein
MRSLSESPLAPIPLSAPLSTIFSGGLCRVLLKDRPVATFDKDQVI